MNGIAILFITEAGQMSDSNQKKAEKDRKTCTQNVET